MYYETFEAKCCWCGEEYHECFKLEENKYLCSICLSYGIDEFKIKEQENKKRERELNRKEASLIKWENDLVEIENNQSQETRSGKTGKSPDCIQTNCPLGETIPDFSVKQELNKEIEKDYG